MHSGCFPVECSTFPERHWLSSINHVCPPHKRGQELSDLCSAGRWEESYAYGVQCQKMAGNSGGFSFCLGCASLTHRCISALPRVRVLKTLSSRA